MAKPRRLTLSTNPKKEELTELRLGDVVYLDGTIYTAREGVYKRALEEKANLPVICLIECCKFSLFTGGLYEFGWKF